MAYYLDNRHRLVGTAILTAGRVQAARQSARLTVFAFQACQASACLLVLFCRYGVPSASEAEDRSFRTIAAACSRYGLAVVDHLVVVATGAYTSAFHGGP